MFQPNLIIDTVQDITPELLQQHGLRSLLLDVDCTLKRYRATEIPPESVRWVESLKNVGIGFCILSNGLEHRIRPIAEQIGIPFVAPAMKPFPFGCRTAIKTMGFEQKSTAMVGDQLFADILAGNLANIFTILVTPIHPEEEHWYTRIKRPLEKWVLRKKEECTTRFVGFLPIFKKSEKTASPISSPETVRSGLSVDAVIITRFSVNQRAMI